MPSIHHSTPRSSYTWKEKPVTVPQPYAHGHVLTENEAAALNQTFAENIRNNLASRLQEQLDAGTFDAEVFQSQIDEYCDEYEFGVRTGGGRSSDPVMTEALVIARDLVRKAIQKAGKYRLADVPAAEITRLAKGAIEKNPAILEKAKARVEEIRAIAEIELGDIAASEPTEAEPESKAKRAKTPAEA